MKETDKTQPISTPPSTGNEPLPPAAPDGNEQPIADTTATPEEDDGFVVVGSGLGIDE